MSMRYIEGNDGLKPFLDDPDKAKAGLASILVAAAKAWREVYGDIPLPSVAEHAYYAIPEGLGVRSTLEIGGKLADQLETEAKRVRDVSGYVSDMMHNPKFTTLEEVTPVELIKLPISALGLSGTPTTRQILERFPQCRVGEYALELCRAEVGPHQAIKDKQPLNDWYYIMHEPISDRYGYPGVFVLGRHDYGLWLSGRWAKPGNEWDPGLQVMFALRKSESKKAVSKKAVSMSV